MNRLGFACGVLLACGGLAGASSPDPRDLAIPEEEVAKARTLVAKLGIKPDGDFVGGEMARIVSNATSKLPQEDIDAIAAYLQSLPPR